MRHIYLVGPRASGKSTLGRLLAERLAMPFIDMDKVIEEHVGSSIADYVRTNGWEAFRAMETGVLQQICVLDPRVVATGGGVVLAADNRQLMTTCGVVLFLRADAEVLLERLRQEPLPGQRPALTGLPAEEEMRQTLAQRAPLYAACAHAVLDAALEPDALLEQALAALRSIRDDNQR